MKNNLSHIAVAIITVVLLLALVDPFMYWMPPMAGMVALVLACVVVIGWAGFVMYEGAADEREAAHRMNADRIAYFASVTILTLALLVQGIQHAVDPWVAFALGVMVVAKVAARIYYESHG
jgi:uncharacterized protein YhhL (DUF1145 family)